MGRTVECGACENRFSVNDEVIQKGAKFYPGERNHKALDGFSRVDGPKIGMDASTPIPRGQAPGYFSPISKVGPLKLTLGWLGVIIILSALGFLYMSELAQEWPVATQVMFALLAGVVGLGLIAFANPRNRSKALLIGGIASAILLSVPFVYRSKRTNSPYTEGVTTPRNPSSEGLEKSAEPATEEQIRNLVGITPLETEIRRLAESGSPLRVYGIWLRDMSPSNRLSVRDYLLRATNGSPTSVIYPRDGRDYLMVLTGLDKTIEQVAEAASKIGRLSAIHQNLQVIEVKVDASIFVEGPIDKLTDKGSPAFYDLNKRELESIQLDRVERAVKRLSDSEPKIYRDDITRQLVLLSSMPQIDFLEEICKALLVWAEDPAVANVPLLNRLNQLHDNRKKVPRSLVAVLAKGKAFEAIPIVQSLWQADATTWESNLQDFGNPVEKGLLEIFPSLEPTLKHSAARILGKVGGRNSIPVLEAARPKAAPELVVLIDSAVRSIRERN